MLLYTDCPNERDTPPPDYGPWCRNGADFRTHECTNHEKPEEEEKQEDHHEKKEPERLAAAVLIYQKTDSERKKGKGKTKFVEKENERSEIFS